jgi:RNA polymerase sigma factor (sigma-70 family)
LEIEQHIAAARARLVRLARGEGIPPEAVEDVVQETLLEGWYHLSNLGTPERLDAWLDGICRNMCRRWRRATFTALRRYERLPELSLDDEALPQAGIIDLVDPLALDPVETLSRQDMEYLLDRALDYLPVQARQLVELCYLKELPQGQVALRLGLTIGALEERLRRARRQLRRILNSELRSAAEALDFPLDTDPLWGWRETREWCNECGNHRLRGIFERAWNGRLTLRMRCPACSQRHGFDKVNSKGIVPLEDLHTFRPALKRTNQVMTAAALRSLQTQTCWRCEGAAPVSISEELRDLDTDRDTFWFTVDCPTCGRGGMTAKQLLLPHPAMQRFIKQHPRWTIANDHALEYAGQPALRLQFRDVTGNARLTFLTHRETMQVLATFLE